MAKTLTCVRQHIPGFCEGFKPEEDWVESCEEMLKLPWVERWSDSQQYGGFVRWARSGDKLMVEYEESFWVVAFAAPELLEELPAWKRKGEG